MHCTNLYVFQRSDDELDLQYSRPAAPEQKRQFGATKYQAVDTTKEKHVVTAEVRYQCFMWGFDAMAPTHSSPRTHHNTHTHIRSPRISGRKFPFSLC